MHHEWEDPIDICQYCDADLCCYDAHEEWCGTQRPASEADPADDKEQP